MSSCKTVGVFAFGQEKYLDVQTFGKQHVDASQRGFDTRWVAVIEHRHILGKTVYSTNLTFGERGAAWGDNILDSSLVHWYNIGVTLNKEALVFLDDGALWLEQAVEFAILDIDGRFRRIEIFSYFFGLLESATAKSDNLTGNIHHREHNTAVKTVIPTASVVIYAQSRVKEVFLVVALPGCSCIECLTVLGGIA